MDGVDKVTGSARYTDDLTFDGMLHARVKRAMVPSAIVKSLDVSRARKLPGVIAVLTAEDIPGKHDHGVVYTDWPVLVGVGEKIRTVGDPVAIVAAESREIATDALELVDVQVRGAACGERPGSGRAGRTRRQFTRAETSSST